MTDDSFSSFIEGNWNEVWKLALKLAKRFRAYLRQRTGTFALIR
ncbi:hypothetical protein [Coleofasciculus sp.]